MDKGAHFYRSDLQIHTPRDGNWKGCSCGSDENERVEFARTFIEKCREIGLQVIAITDHHDFCLVRYIQGAAQDESGAVESPDPSRQNPIVFPGVEVTLSAPCQVLVLLDAAAPSSLHEILLQTLGVTPSPPSEAKYPQPKPLPRIKEIGELDKSLASRSELQGRYIVLPHVGKDGHKTVLRNGFCDKYRDMPCVGGYVECDWSRLHGRNLNIIEGRDPNWGNKAVGVFQTTDARSLDRLGERSTWVKLGELTAEALRQACLARHSRISQEPPRLPRTYISRVKIQGSTFMDDIEVELNPQMNAIIGGRGTGKSTVLEYVRWAMHDQAESELDGSSSWIAEERRDFVKTTLEDNKGAVEVEWKVDGAIHRLRRDVSARALGTETTLQIEGDDPRLVTPEEVRRVLGIRAYSQKELSAVGAAARELRRFVERPIQGRLADADSSIEEQARLVREVYATVIKRRRDETQLRTVDTELLSARSKEEATQKSLPELSLESSAALDGHPVRLKEEEATRTILEDLEKARSALSTAGDSIRGIPRPLALHKESPQRALLDEMHGQVAKLVGAAQELLDGQIKEINAGLNILRTKEGEWRTGHDAFLDSYEKAKQENSTIEGTLAELTLTREKIAELESRNALLRSVLAKSNDANDRFDQAWDQWVRLHKTRSDLIEEACADLTKFSEGDIEVVVKRGADFGAALEKLTASLQGTRIHQSKVEDIAASLGDAEKPVDMWRGLLDELRGFAETPLEACPTDASLPDMKSMQLTVNQRRKLVEKLDPDSWIALALSRLEDATEFTYVGGGQRVPFMHASAGQQATALLRVLLRDSKAPLIIDQPEEDLDNQVIGQIVEGIHEAKQSRQLIFASHNANLVVNGDAELILHCHCHEVGGISRGHIACQGAIDAELVRKAISDVMEGGREAFELRRNKYGF